MIVPGKQRRPISGSTPGFYEDTAPAEAAPQPLTPSRDRKYHPAVSSLVRTTTTSCLTRPSNERVGAKAVRPTAYPWVTSSLDRSMATNWRDTYKIIHFVIRRRSRPPRYLITYTAID